jgi:23S rRNA pseudouridine1911/1915/1917 synthase
MKSLELRIIHEDKDILVIDKPAGIVVFPEGKTKEKTLIDYLLESHSELKNVGEAPRYGIVHRLDKDTSGILLVAKNNKSLIYLQKQFKESSIEKKYLALVVGNLKNKQGTIETLIGRAPKNKKKQRVYLPHEPGAKGKREAITEYKVLEKFKDYNLIEVKPKTGRKHQIRCHLSYLGHPIAGDKIYGFKKQLCPRELNRHFLHAGYIKIKLPDGEIKEFKSELDEELRGVLQKLNSEYAHKIRNF